MDTAKVFMTGRSQAVRLPKAYRFDTSEVTIEKMADGSVVLRPKPTGGLGTRLWALLEGLPDDPSFQRPEQLPLERDAAWWDAQFASEAEEKHLAMEALPAPLNPRPKRRGAAKA